MWWPRLQALLLVGLTVLTSARASDPPYNSSPEASDPHGVWLPLAPSGLPLHSGTGVWTGTQLLVWDGVAGGAYDPATDSWQPISNIGGPPSRAPAVWTGTETNSLHADLALDALEMAIWRRQHQDLTGLIHHSDRGVQYLSIRYTERLADAGAVCSVGSRGDSYDNALAEAVNGLYKAEVIRKSGPWRSLEQVELATAEWVDWWNHRRLHSAIGDVPPAEFEAHYHQQHAVNQAA